MKARIHPITGAIESYTTKPKRVVNKFDTNFFVVSFNNCSDETESNQGFENVSIPDPIDGKMYSEVKGTTGNFYVELIDIPPAPPMPEPTINIDTRAINTAIGKYFIPKYGIDFQMYFPMIMNNLKDAPVPMYRQNMVNLREFSLLYKQAGKITQEDLEAFEQIFIDNGFNLNEYLNK